uniref:Uncharacterized protein n=1 Tax=Arundo donax TaxID=35708 RepID=A0A0A9BZA7_ARUDO
MPATSQARDRVRPWRRGHSGAGPHRAGSPGLTRAP